MASLLEPTKKRKRTIMEDINISAPLYDPPKHFSVSGLYDPTLVVVEVSNDSDPSWTQKFTLPLDLLSSRSPYFKTLFDGSFAEAEQGYVKLSDVSPWVFRVFVGWLYYQNIFYDVENKKPRRLPGKPKPHQASTKTYEGRTDRDIKTMLSDSHAASTPVIDLTEGESTAGSTSKVLAEKLSTTQRSDPSSTTTTTTHPSSQTKLTRRHPPGGRSGKYHQETEITYGEIDGEDECNYREPTTWTFRWLFEIYIFSDQYDVRDFRMTVFEIIQMKLYQQKPRAYQLPHIEYVVFAVENSPPQSPLYRLLVDCFAKWLREELDEEDEAEFYEVLPAHFLSRCLVAAKRSYEAGTCAKCKPQGTGEKCTMNHTSEDWKNPPTKDICTYHEHGDDDEEKARCTLRWESRYHLL